MTVCVCVCVSTTGAAQLIECSAVNYILNSTEGFVVSNVTLLAIISAQAKLPSTDGCFQVQMNCPDASCLIHTQDSQMGVDSFSTSVSDSSGNALNGLQRI